LLGFVNLNFRNKGIPTIYNGQPEPFGLAAPLGADTGTPSARDDNVWSIADNLGFQHGQHNWKLGAEYRYIRLDVQNEGPGRGLIEASAGLVGFSSIARVAPEFGGGFDRSFRTHSFAGFAQDQWRLPNLTLNYGLRYEVNTAPVEARNRLVNYYPNILGPGVGGLVRSGDSTIMDEFGNTLGTASLSTARAGFGTDFNNWGPHLGFAWSPRGSERTVVRGGYAVMFDQQPLEPSLNMLLNPPFVMQDFSVSDPQLESNFSTCDPIYTEGAACLSQAPGTYASWFRQRYSITARDPHTRTPYVQQWNLGVQRQLGTRALFEVAYIGSAGHKLPRLRDLSSCTPALFWQSLSTGPCAFSIETDADIPPPYNLQSVPFSTGVLNQENSSNASFNSLLLRFETRAFRGLQMGAHYEFAKSIDDASSLQPQISLLPPDEILLFANPFTFSTYFPNTLAEPINFNPTLSLRPGLPVITTRPDLPQDSGNLKGDRGLSDFDVRNRLVLNLLYSVRQLGGLGVLGKGWQLAGLSTLQSGQPYSVFLDFDGSPLRPNLRRRPVIDNHNPQSAIELDLPSYPGLLSPNPASPFDVTPNLSLAPGNLGRNTFSGPALKDTDFAILKNTALGTAGRKTMQFRVEFFNLFNTTNFFQPYTHIGYVSSNGGFNCIGCSNMRGNFNTFSDPFAGQILQARPARQIQFALKFNF